MAETQNKPIVTPRMMKNQSTLSIEAQVAVKALVTLKINGFDIPDDLEYALIWWCREALEPWKGVLSGLGKEPEKITKLKTTKKNGIQKPVSILDD